MSTGEFPGNDAAIGSPRQRECSLGEFAGLRHETDVLNPFELARYAKLLVVPFEQLEEMLSAETVEHLLGAGRNAWSGGAAL